MTRDEAIAAGQRESRGEFKIVEFPGGDWDFFPAGHPIYIPGTESRALDTDVLSVQRWTLLNGEWRQTA